MNTEHYLVLSADADDVPGTLAAHGWFGDYGSATAYADCNGGVAISCGREYQWIEVDRHEVYGLVVVAADDSKHTLNVMIRHRVKRCGGEPGMVVQVKPWNTREEEGIKGSFIASLHYFQEQHVDQKTLSWLSGIEVNRKSNGEFALVPIWVA